MPLQSVKDFTTTMPRGKVGPILLLAAKGNDGDIYVIEVDQNTGQIPVNATGAAITVGLGSPDTVPRNASVIGGPVVLDTAGTTGYKSFTRTAFTKSVAGDGSALDVSVINAFGTETTLAAINTKVATETTAASIDTTVSAVNGKLATLGQKTAAGSMPVTLASDQGNIGVTVSNAFATEATLSAVNNKLPSLESGNIPIVQKKNLIGVPTHDHFSVNYPTSTTEVYTYKSGGSGGATVATITITYVDATKAQISSVQRS